MRVAVLGGGSIARKAYLPLLLTWPGTQVVGLLSRTQKTVDEVMSAWPIAFGTTDLEALLERRPEAAFVLTATPSHFELSHRLLEAGVDVYLEKPATTSSQETRFLADLAKERQRILMVGFNRRYALLYRQARERFAAHRIQLCVIEKHRPTAFHTSLYDNYLDDTIHQIDLMRFFCGEGTPVHTSFEMRGGKLVGALSVVALEGGGRAVILTSLMAGAWQERVSLHGDRLTVDVDAFRELRVKYTDREEVYGQDRPARWIPESLERGFMGAIEHFFECVRQRHSPQTDGYDSARTQELLEAMVACAG